MSTPYDNTKNEIEVVRIYCTENETVGKFLINGEYICDTLEDRYRDLTKEEKKAGKTAIPYNSDTAKPMGYRKNETGAMILANTFQWKPQSRYSVEITLSGKGSLGRYLLAVNSVPGFSGIRIHMGVNHTYTEGCILCGIANKAKDGTWSLKDSLPFERDIINRLTTKVESKASKQTVYTSTTGTKVKYLTEKEYRAKINAEDWTKVEKVSDSDAPHAKYDPSYERKSTVLETYKRGNETVSKTERITDVRGKKKEMGLTILTLPEFLRKRGGSARDYGFLQNDLSRHGLSAPLADDQKFANDTSSVFGKEANSSDSGYNAPGISVEDKDDYRSYKETLRR